MYRILTFITSSFTAGLFLMLMFMPLMAQEAIPICPPKKGPCGDCLEVKISSNIVLVTDENTDGFKITYKTKSGKTNVTFTVNRQVCGGGVLIDWERTEVTAKKVTTHTLNIQNIGGFTGEGSLSAQLTFNERPRGVQEGPDGKKHPVDPIVIRNDVKLKKEESEILFAVVNWINRSIDAYREEQRNGKNKFLPAFDLDSQLKKYIRALIASQPGKLIVIEETPELHKVPDKSKD